MGLAQAIVYGSTTEHARCYVVVVCRLRARETTSSSDVSIGTIYVIKAISYSLTIILYYDQSDATTGVVCILKTSII